MGLFNLNLEYFVYNSWLDKLAAILSPPSQVKPLATAETTPLSVLPPPAQLNVTISDCTIGLNPLDVPSRGLVLLTSTAVRGQWDFQDGGRGKFDVSLNKAHLFCIDDTSNLLPPPRILPRGRASGRKEILGHFSVVSSERY